MNGYACHNRPPYSPTITVQDGWTSAALPGQTATTRRPRMVEIPFRMSKQCEYTLTKLGQEDKQCAGCAWRKEVQ